MSRNKTQAELDAEMEAEDAANAARYHVQSNCGHYNCHPTEWYWSGQIRMMWCEDCGLSQFIDEVCDE